MPLRTPGESSTHVPAQTTAEDALHAPAASPENISSIPIHSLDAEGALRALDASPNGLSSAQAEERLRIHGRNLLQRREGESPWRMLFRQVNNPIGWLLSSAGLIALLLGKLTDAAVVFGAVAVNALIGFVQEFKAGRAIQSLSSLVPERAAVLRNGRTESIPVAELVPGDMVLLQGGDKVPADLRLIFVKNLHVDEASLTGESLPVTKTTEPAAADAPLGDRRCMAYGGTNVVQGAGRGVVSATGNATELGRINALLQKTDVLETPLTRQLTRLSLLITLAVLAGVVVLFGFGVFIKSAPPAEAILVAVTLAVAAIPEGLPAVITIALAIGVKRMALRNAVVRHLPAVETLGSTSVICSDKTGTLTRNEMTVQAAWIPEKEYRFSGVGYAPSGEVERDGVALDPLPEELHDLLLAALLCNDADLRRIEDEWTIQGDPTEAALVVAAAKAGLDSAALRAEHPRMDVLPFDSETKFMATQHTFADRRTALLKGAPEVVLDRCALTPRERDRALAAMETYARQGMRVMAFARMEMTSLEFTAATLNGMEFLGLTGMIDPPRTEAMDAVAECRRAGIVVKMITGDHPVTAEAIAGQLGITSSAHPVLRGQDLDTLSDEQLKDALTCTHVFARVAPEHKLRLVKALQEKGHVAAMTGDGVNDAPALKRADIGVAMGVSGTDVAKEAAKVVLMDDNFASIAAAVREGRRVYDNLIKALAFILPTNLSLACTLAAAMFFFPTIPVEGVNELLLAMSPTQTLWINLVASVALSIPIAFEALEPGAMRRLPRPAAEPVFSGFVRFRLVLVAVVISTGACLLFLWEYFRMAGPMPIGPAAHAQALAEAQTVCVTAITCSQIFYLLNCRSLRDSILAQGLFTNKSIFAGIAVLAVLQGSFIYLPAMNRIFGTAPLDALALVDAVLAGAVILPVISVEKWIHRRFLAPRRERALAARREQCPLDQAVELK